MIPLAVVPIFMSAGAAVFPTLLAAFTSIAAIALKPRELLHLARRHPLAASITAALMIAAIFLATHWLTATPVRAAAHTSTSRSPIDWAQVARDILARQNLAAATQATSTPSTPTHYLPAHTLSAPIIEDHDPARTSYAGGLSPIHLESLWTFRPEDALFLAAPAIANNRVYVAACQSDLGGYTGLLACLDADSGKPLWQISDLAGTPLLPFFSSPAITQDGKYLLIGQGLHQDRDCSLLCFDTTTHQLLWSVKTPLHLESSPAIFGDIAVIGAGAIEGTDGRPIGDPGFVLAVRISDGKELWRAPVNDPESSPVFGPDGTVYIGSGFNGSAVVALRSDSDEILKSKNLPRLLWRTAFSQPITSSISLTGDLILAGGGNSDVVHANQDAHGLVAALDRATGAIRWQTPFNDAVLGGSAVRNDTLISPVRTGEVAALALSDGHILWRNHISGNAPVIASCAFTPDHIYAVSSDGYLAILDPKDGHILEKLYLNDQAKPGTGLSTSPPQVANGRVFVGSETGGLHCYIGTGAAP